jgi:hypothetical protein
MTWSAAATGWKGQGHFDHHMSLISVKLGPVLHNYSRPCYNVIEEKSNIEFSVQKSQSHFFNKLQPNGLVPKLPHEGDLDEL